MNGSTDLLKDRVVPRNWRNSSYVIFPSFKVLITCSAEEVRGNGGDEWCSEKQRERERERERDELMNLMVINYLQAKALWVPKSLLKH